MEVKKQASSILSQTRIKEYTTYLIPIGFLLIVENLWRTERNISAVFVGTFVFFIYFYLADYFIKDYSKNNISKDSEYVLFIFVFMVITFPFYSTYGLNFYNFNKDQFSGGLNWFFLIIIVTILALLELKRKEQKIITTISKEIIILSLAAYFCYLFKTYLFWKLVTQYNLEFYVIMSLSFFGIGVICIITEVVFSTVEKSKWYKSIVRYTNK